MMTLEECRRWSDEFARTHRITVEERTTMPTGAAAFAEWRARRVVVPPLTNMESFAVRLHEYGHILSGDCPNTRPHYRDPKVTEWWRCLACETDAWTVAMREMPFDRAMFQRLQRSLATYRRSTPAHPEAITRARQIASDTHYAACVVARTERERRLDVYADMQAIAAEARRPRLLSKLERQIADVKRWAMEDGR